MVKLAADFDGTVTSWRAGGLTEAASADDKSDDGRIVIDSP
jgi:hypothetical protein